MRKRNGLSILFVAVVAGCTSRAEVDLGTKKAGFDPSGSHPFSDGGHIAAENDGEHRYFGTAMIDADHALVSGNIGILVMALDTVTELSLGDDTRQGYRVAYDPDRQIAWMGKAKEPVLIQFDASDLHAVVMVEDYHDEVGLTEHLSAEQGRVLVGTEGRAVLVDADTGLTAKFDTGSSYGVGMVGDRAIIADGNLIGLWDLSDPTAPSLIDQIEAGDLGWDVAFDGTRAAVSLGSSGVDIFEVTDDVLSLTTHFDLPRSNYDVAMDGDHLWIAGWSGTWIADLAADPPALLGEDPALALSWTLTAGWGRALVGEFDIAHVLEQRDGGGPEISVTEEVLFPVDGPRWMSFEIRNDGLSTLKAALEPVGCLTSTLEVAPEPGEREVLEVVLTGPIGEASLTWYSNDPDEGTGHVDMIEANDIIGLPHPPFEESAFTWPVEDLGPVTQEDFLGKVTFLNYFRHT